MKNSCIYKKEFKDKFICDAEPFLGEDGKYHFIYKIEFPNGKYYIGEHTTKSIDDGYYGSGALLPLEFSKVKTEEVKKIILSFHGSKEEMEINEEKTIGDLYKTDKNCLNLIKGGSKGFNEHIIEKSVNKRKGKKRTKESIEKQRISCTGKHHKLETRKKQSDWHKNFWLSSESDEKRKRLSEAARNRVITEEFRKNISEKRKAYNKSEYGKNMNRYRYYADEVNSSIYKEKIYELLEKSKNENLSNDERLFLFEFWEKCKYERKKYRALKKKENKKKYVFTEEHRKNISRSKKGKKASNETKEKMSKRRSGRGNSRYISNKIQMMDINGNNLIMTFNDCIEATDYVRNNINKNASGSEIFVACREDRVRYGHKWRMVV